MTAIPAVFAVVFALMLLEARRAAANERAQRARGGVEPPGDVYALMQVIYPASFLMMLAEGAWRGAPSRPIVLAGAAIFVAAKAIKWWAILSLGPFWTFRVIVVPGSRRIISGPYRFVPHPNYVAVVGEFIAVAMMTGAVVSGPLALLAFAALLVKRIAVEERALHVATR
ncbi:MAG TPA: isoprenylcysteine carboxylmethyltransferase family protein [Vicinamibacterales bacterium]|nr:isoprenylcysteine carboxylmethyltransferase family protein [Vicinamibacterales bacterium]